MRDVLHALALIMVLLLASVCTLIQVGDLNTALYRLQHDEVVVQPVSSSTR